MLCVLLQVKAYCESQTRFKGYTIEQLFPDHVFPNATQEDMRKSEGGREEEKGGRGREEGWRERREGRGGEEGWRERREGRTE